MISELPPAISPIYILIVVIAILSLIFLWNKTKRPYSQYESSIPPYPYRPWPLIGHFFALGKNFMKQIEEYHEKAGDIFSLDMAGQLHIFVSGYKNFKELLVDHGAHVLKMPPLFTDRLLNEENKGLLAADEKNWKQQRSTSLMILRNLGLGKSVMAEKIEEEVQVYLNKISDIKGCPQDVNTLTNVCVANVICSIAVGQRFEHDETFFLPFVHLVGDFFMYYLNTLILTSVPVLYYLPGDLFDVKKFMKACADLDELFAKKFIRKIKNSLTENEEPHNFISAYLLEILRNENKGENTLLDEKNLEVLIRTFLIVGMDTTSSTIMWCFVYMLHFPEVQEKVYQEIKSVVGTDRPPNINDKQNLKYLNAVTMEIQRFASIAPIAMRRVVSSTFQFQGYTFPKNSIVWPNMDSILHSQKNWGDPEKFRPERFLDKQGNLLNPEEMIPFSVGKRSCLGESLARMELFLFLSSLFQKFRFEPAEETESLPSLEGVISSVRRPLPFKMRFIERLT